MLNQRRMSRVLRHMDEEGLPQIIVSATASVYYLTGLWVDPRERMLALLIDRSGEAVLFGNEIFGLSSENDLPFLSHSDSDDPVADLARRVKSGVIGIDKSWPAKFLIGLMAARPDLVPKNGSAPVDRARMCKDAEELAAMRHASAVNDRVVEAIIGELRPGVSEGALAMRLGALYLEFGADGANTDQLVCFGAGGADPHHAAGSALLQSGDSVIFDIFTPVNRYWCDMTRTVFFGKVSEKQREVYELVREANLAGIRAVRPGMPMKEFDRTAREVIERGGYGKYFTHRLGHGIGLECHEPPDASSASETEARPGMVFSIEPGIYLPGEFGVRIEDLVAVTETGCEVLNRAPKELRVIGG